MSSVLDRAAVSARRAGYTAPARVASRYNGADAGESSVEASQPVTRAAPDRPIRRVRHSSTAGVATGSSCSSHIRMPVSPIASTSAAVVSFAASYFTCKRWPIRSAAIASTPGIGFSRRSRMTTSSLQSIPSTRKTASAWSSQTAQAVGLAMLLHVAQPLPEQREDVFVVEGVVNQPSVPARAHDPGVSQEPKLVRDGGFGQAEELGQMADAQLAARQDVEDANPRGIAQDFEDIGEGADRVRVQELCAFIL